MAAAINSSQQLRNLITQFQADTEVLDSTIKQIVSIAKELISVETDPKGLSQSAEFQKILMKEPNEHEELQIQGMHISDFLKSINQNLTTCNLALKIVEPIMRRINDTNIHVESGRPHLALDGQYATFAQMAKVNFDLIYYNCKETDSEPQASTSQQLSVEFFDESNLSAISNAIKPSIGQGTQANKGLMAAEINSSQQLKNLITQLQADTRVLDSTIKQIVSIAKELIPLETDPKGLSQSSEFQRILMLEPNEREELQIQSMHISDFLKSINQNLTTCNQALMTVDPIRRRINEINIHVESSRPHLALDDQYVTFAQKGVNVDLFYYNCKETGSEPQSSTSKQPKAEFFDMSSLSIISDVVDDLIAQRTQAKEKQVNAPASYSRPSEH